MFQFTRPVGGATGCRLTKAAVRFGFQFTRPVGGATCVEVNDGKMVAKFQFTRPVGGATQAAREPCRCAFCFNSRAPWGARRFALHRSPSPHLRVN